MNKVLKLAQMEDSRVWMSSDWHFNHNPKWPVPIWKMRGYNSMEEMNIDIIKSINDNVGVNDNLIYLGDMVLNTVESQFENFISRINCQSIYVLYGNHNSCVWDIYRREINKFFKNLSGIDQGDCEYEVYPFRYRNLIYVGNYLEFTVDGTKAVASHYPMSSWNGMSHGSIHCHGHIHSTKETYKLDGKTIDVGFDYHKLPISFNEIKKMMDTIPKKQEGHH